VIVEQCAWRAQADWQPHPPGTLIQKADLVLAFGSPRVLSETDLLDRVHGAYADARVVACSTAGEIWDSRVLDDSLVVTAMRFDSTRIQCATVDIDEEPSSRDAGKRLAGQLDHDELVHVLVFSDGLRVNGSRLVMGLTEGLPNKVAVTGGLSGDGARMERTLVGLDWRPREGQIVAVGLYGSRLDVRCGSMGGWDPFGPERLITRSRGNVLFELDGESALALYKRYLGEHSAQLPSSALLFPLSVRTTGADTAVVRTILSIDEAAQSMTFAGDLPEGAYARLMKANFDRLIDGAQGAAQAAQSGGSSAAPELALLISCVGRKLVLQQRVEEEVESVREVLGPRPIICGFYSYGEISPFTPNATCELHNQTMTITTISER
jgi:hypothetical protein